MLNVKFIKEHRADVICKLAKKNFTDVEKIDLILDLYLRQNDTQAILDDNFNKLNTFSKQIGVFFKEGNIQEATKRKVETGKLKEKNKILNVQLTNLKQDLNKLLTEIPNIPHDKVPKGNGDNNNVEIFKKGNIPQLPPNYLPHWELTKKYDIIDFELGVKITGAGFPLYKGKGAILQRALINFFLSEAFKAGYIEIMPPIMVNESAAFGTGQLPDKEAQMYYIKEDNLYLIPTAEIPLTNIYRDTIIKEKDLPIKNTAYTPCFRREAGSYGKDVRGLNRLHQFDKVEIVRVETPENSYKALDEMVEYVKCLIDKLELPYRIVCLCGGDLSFTSALTYDFEVYSAAQQKWLEVSSVSNFETYQSNRLKIRYRSPDKKKTGIAHTLNGSALALPRILAAILENNQTEKGIVIPKVLIPFTGFKEI